MTIRNLVIRNMPQRGIHAYYYMSDHWTVEYNEIASSKNVGIVFPAPRRSGTTTSTTTSYRRLHGGLAPTTRRSTATRSPTTARQQKVSESANVTFRNNFVHHNAGAGIWYDSDNTGALIEGNRVEDNGRTASATRSAAAPSSATTRSAGAAIPASSSPRQRTRRFTATRSRTTFRGITYFVNCPSVGAGAISFDLANNSSHDNPSPSGRRPTRSRASSTTRTAPRPRWRHI